MSTYEPGTVAVATVRGVPNVRVFRMEDNYWRHLGINGASVTHNDDITDVRPLVVIDPEGQEVNRLIHTLGTHFRGGCADMREALRCLLLPPKPAEPTGDGAVVEDVNGYRWVRIAGQGEGRCSPPWRHRGYTARHWESVNAVRVLSEGVQP